MLENVMQNRKVEAVVLRWGVQTMVAQKRHGGRWLDPIGLPTEVLETVQKPAVATAEVQHFGARQRRLNGQVRRQRLQEQIARAPFSSRLSRLRLFAPEKSLLFDSLRTLLVQRGPRPLGRVEPI